MSGHRWYRAFGLLIRSDITIPEYRSAKPGTPDITIGSSDAAREARQDIERQGIDVRGAHLLEDGMLLHVERVGDFIIRNGSEIELSPLPDAEMNFLRLYLVGSVMGTLFHQRGQFIFHGAAILAQDQVSVFVGDSGTGKSTLISHLTLAGYPALADDTLPVLEDTDGFLAWPGAQVFKMWEDAIQSIGKSAEGLTQVSQRYGKYFLENPCSAPDRATPVAEVFVLQHGPGFSIEPLGGLQAIAALNEHTYRREFIGFLGQDERYFAQLSRLVEKLRFYRFVRPNDASRLPEAIAALEKHWTTAD